MIKIMGLIAAAVLLTAAIAPAARADSTAFVASPLYTIIGSGPVNLGMVFTANSNITVDALGYFDIFDSYGIIVAPATVAIYDSSGNLLSSTVVSPGSPVVDGYFYQAITPINLTAGNQYTVDEFSSDGNWAYSFGAPLTTAPILLITTLTMFLQAAWSSQRTRQVSALTSAPIFSLLKPRQSPNHLHCSCFLQGCWESPEPRAKGI